MTDKPDVAALVEWLQTWSSVTENGKRAHLAAAELTRLAAENRTYAEAHAFNSERFVEMLSERDAAKAEIARLREAGSLSLFARLQGKLAAIEDALDEANAPSINGARWLTLPERVAALAALKHDTGELVDYVEFTDGTSLMGAEATAVLNRPIIPPMACPHCGYRHPPDGMCV